MVSVKITAYGAKDAVLREWHGDVLTLGLGLTWCSIMAAEVSQFCREHEVHFVDQHIYDPQQDARNR